MIAQKVYAQSRGEKGGLTWQPVPKIIDALEAVFYATFKNVEPCGNPVLLALDVSGSMGGSNIAGSCLTAREASAAMALVTAATERECHIMAFADRFMPLNISPRMRLDGVIKAGSYFCPGWKAPALAMRVVVPRDGDPLAGPSPLRAGAVPAMPGERGWCCSRF